jgi:CheY-like chemotaxis protein
VRYFARQHFPAVRSSENQQVRILFAEDDECTRFIIGRALRRSLGERGTVHMVDDGALAIAYLCGDDGFADRRLHPFPSLLITDLNMPRVDGFSVLEFLQMNPSWSVIPKIVFSSSTDPDDVRTAFLLGASAYHQKPCSASALSSCVDLMISYWTTCHVPQVDAQGRIIATAQRGKLGERYPTPEAGPTMIKPALRTSESRRT